MASGLKVEKKPKEMGGIVQGDVVEENGRLVGAAAAHVQAAADMSDADWMPGSSLQAAEEIGLANGRHLLQRLDL